MRRFSLPLLTLLLLSGCESLNDAVVRRWFEDPALSRRVGHQIKDGLERREATPAARPPAVPAPAFLDQG